MLFSPCHILILFIAVVCLSPAWAAADDIDGNLANWQLPEARFPASNPYSEAKALLGKQLFFDARLNHNHTACTHCHDPGLNWSDGLPQAIVDGHVFSRHTPALINLAYYPVFFWDGRAENLEEAIRGHMQDSHVLGQQDIALNFIRNNREYAQAFEMAFSKAEITLDEVVAAISTFLRTIIVRDTPFDRWVKGDEKAVSQAAKRGFKLFTGKARCVRCHKPPMFSDFRFHRSGSYSIDPGRFEVTRNPAEHHAFRTPPLRQVGLTAPYMHDGQKANLASVVDYYIQGGERRSGGDDLTIQLSAAERNDLLAFLYTLSEPAREISVPPLPPSTH